MSDVSFDRRAPTYPWRRAIIYKESIYLAIIEKSDTENSARPLSLLRNPDEKHGLSQSLIIRFVFLVEITTRIFGVNRNGHKCKYMTPFSENVSKEILRYCYTVCCYYAR